MVGYWESLGEGRPNIDFREFFQGYIFHTIYDKNPHVLVNAYKLAKQAPNGDQILELLGLVFTRRALYEVYYLNQRYSLNYGYRDYDDDEVRRQTEYYCSRSHELPYYNELCSILQTEDWEVRVGESIDPDNIK